MDIHVVSADCVRIGLTADECVRLGLSYADFSPESLSARLFIATVLTRLHAEGTVSDYPQKLTAEVFEDGGGLAVYISGRGLSCRTQDSAPDSEETVLLVKTPEEVIAAAGGLREDTHAELYSFGNGYALAADVPLRGGRRSELLSAAVREYGKLLTDAPKSVLRDLTL
ncbi:MAG: hypothetical protein K6B74_04550 [Ruminococcus sp.]|nr:hypothetical protein [Ruminococcus sp.]